MCVTNMKDASSNDVHVMNKNLNICLQKYDQVTVKVKKKFKSKFALQKPKSMNKIFPSESSSSN